MMYNPRIIHTPSTSPLYHHSVHSPHRNNEVFYNPLLRQCQWCPVFTLQCQPNTLQSHREEAVSGHTDIPSIVIHHQAREHSSKPPSLPWHTNTMHPSTLHTLCKNPPMTTLVDKYYLQRPLYWSFTGQRNPNPDDESSHKVSSRSKSNNTERANANNATKSSAQNYEISGTKSSVNISSMRQNLQTSSAILESISATSLPVPSKPTTTNAARPSPNFTITADTNVITDTLARKNMCIASHGNISPTHPTYSPTNIQHNSPTNHPQSCTSPQPRHSQHQYINTQTHTHNNARQFQKYPFTPLKPYDKLQTITRHTESAVSLGRDVDT
jgi:hypothetical protein